MAEHDIDPVLQQLVRPIDEPGPAAAPVIVSVHGTVLAGDLIAQRAFLGELVAGLRGDGEVSEGLWRLGLESIDGWTLHAGAEDERGPFARLLGSSP
jgi:hypothetical protein